MFHITHAASSEGIPLGRFLSDSAARSSYGPVHQDNKPVSANEQAQRQSERSPVGLEARVCLGHCLLTPVTEWCSWCCHDDHPVMATYWFSDKSKMNRNLYFFFWVSLMELGLRCCCQNNKTLFELYQEMKKWNKKTPHMVWGFWDKPQLTVIIHYLHKLA